MTAQVSRRRRSRVRRVWSRLAIGACTRARP